MNNTGRRTIVCERTTTAAVATGAAPAGPGTGTNAPVPAPHRARQAADSPLDSWMCAP
ncbi:hypothetical protein ABZ864_11575 [Streptomyces sp. NPDC047082]|uniref:hypothetical protein n=1 Tax=Streptomyces sp. NPDC047082 TaxID=3155259 RepID=UPI003401E468